MSFSGSQKYFFPTIWTTVEDLYIYYIYRFFFFNLLFIKNYYYSKYILFKDNYFMLFIIFIEQLFEKGLIQVKTSMFIYNL